MIFAVIDTNVIVAAMMSKHSDSATVKVINAVRDGRLRPVLSPDIVAEYGEVLSRSKFQFVEADVRQTIDAIVSNAIFLEPKLSGETFADESDRVFYEVALSEEGSRLVTGNTKHFPKSPIVVTPAELLELIKSIA